MASSFLHDEAYHAGFSNLLLYDLFFSHFPSVQLIYLVHYHISLLLLLSLLLLQVLLLSPYHHNLLAYGYRSYSMEIPLANLIISLILFFLILSNRQFHRFWFPLPFWQA